MHLSTSQAAPGATIEDRIEDLLGRMTLEEKIRLCHAGSKFAVSAIPRLGIPEFWMSDGPHGVRHEICRDSWDPVETEEDRSTACVKHYAANSQELNRQGVNAQMDERTLREIYMPGFKAAVVDGECLAVMGAYNKFRGQYCSHNNYLVQGILKGEWNFDGCFLSDWAAVEDTFEAARFGLDLEMGTGKPYDEYYLARPFREAIERGELEEDLVNDKARRNLRVMFRIGMFDTNRTSGERNTAKHHQRALEIARETIVLLKNERGVLPLEKDRLSRVVVIGDNAIARHAQGGHSSGVKALYEATPLEGLRNRLGSSVVIDHFQGSPAKDGDFERIDPEFLGIADQGAGTHGWKAVYWRQRDCRGEGIRKADVAIDFDWTNSTPFPGELIARIAGLNPRTVVVLVSGSPVEMPWVDNVPAIVQMWYAGMEGGNAIADVLIGNTNPSGKLPMTFPKELKDSPAHALGDYGAEVCRYEEGIFVGYRWFDAKNIEPLFPFGHGLSYTEFELSGLSVETTTSGVRASLAIRNAGLRAGAEVIQVYVGQPVCSVERPTRELKEFAKVFLEPGASTRVEFDLPRAAFAFWSDAKNDWVLEPGEFLIEAGVSSRRIILKRRINLD